MTQTDPEESVDIVGVILRQVADRAEGTIDAATLQQIEQTVRDQYGGLRVRIIKRRKRLTDAERQQLFQDGLAGLPESEILAKHRISRATLFRQMKRGGGRFG